MGVVYQYQGKGNDQDKETENQEVRKIPMGFLFTEQQTFGVKAICNQFGKEGESDGRRQ